jgi:hypothetical protein
MRIICIYYRLEHPDFATKTSWPINCLPIMTVWLQRNDYNELRYSRGETPAQCWNARLKVLGDRNPMSVAMCWISLSEPESNWHARIIRTRFSNIECDVPSSASRRWNDRGLRFTSLDTSWSLVCPLHTNRCIVFWTSQIDKLSCGLFLITP